MPSRCLISVAALAAVSGLACSLSPASVTIYGGPTYNSTTGTGYQSPNLPVIPGESAGIATAIGFASKYAGGTNLGPRAIRWDASGTAATELGNLGTNGSGSTSAYAYAINSAGTTVGSASKYSGGTNRGLRAVRWDASGTAATELGNLGTSGSGSTACVASAINSTGTAVGHAQKYSGNTPLGNRAVRWDASGTAALELGNLGTNNSGVADCAAYAINSTGTAVGIAQKYSGNTPLGNRAVRWDASGTAATELGNLGTSSSGSTECVPFAINSTGTAVGHAQNYSGNTSLGISAVRWDASGTVATELGNIGADNTGATISYAFAINSTGTAVGRARKWKYPGTFLGDRAVRWDASGTGATELGNLGTNNAGITYSEALDINDAGIAVGYAYKYSGSTYIGMRAVYWGFDGEAVDVNTLLSPADAARWTLTSAAGISDTNWVTGIGTFDPDGPGGLDSYARMFLLQLPNGGCLSDFNHDGFVNGDDYDLFASLFDVADPGADINQDGFVNGDDYDAFASAFDAGC
ncbi:MAG: DUF3466 family protein [Phycisphaerae bacterium]|nr:DUF3466 family protein [Phycisphaerae bacterium]